MAMLLLYMHISHALPRTTTKGFTIVELLIVIVVIAILAAVTIVAYTGIQRRAIESTLQSDLSEATTIVANQKTENGVYPSDLNSGLFIPSANNDYQYRYDPATETYCMTVVSYAANGLTYHRNNDGPVEPGPCPSHTSGALTNANTWKSVSVGTTVSCGITKADVAYCWGYNTFGQLGNNSTTNSATPVPVYMGGALAGKTITKIEVGSMSTCAIASDKKVYCWGYAYYAGTDSTTGNLTVPTAISTANVPANYQATDLSMGDYYRGCFVADGKAYCWGLNTSGSLGDGTTTTRNQPVPVGNNGGINSKTITKISVGFQNTCAIASGEVYCWGGGRGNANSADTTKRYYPYSIDASAYAGKTVTDVMSANAVSCAIADGKVYCWGGQSLTGASDTPIANGILGPTLVDDRNMGDYHAEKLFGESILKCIVASEGVYCWAKDMNGNFTDEVTGNPSQPTSYIPVQVRMNNKTNAVDGSAGLGGACAVGENSRLYCWGRDKAGRLGVTTVTQGQSTTDSFRYTSPQLVLDPQ